MKRHKLVLTIILISVVFVILGFSTYYLIIGHTTRMVGDVTVHEISVPGGQLVRTLASDNSHKGVAFSLESENGYRAYIFDMVTEEYSAITGSNMQMSNSFTICDDYVFWHEDNDLGGIDVKCYDHDTEETTIISMPPDWGRTDHFGVLSVAPMHDLVICNSKEEETNGYGDFDIVAFDISPPNFGERIDICTASGDQFSPRVSGNIVCWKGRRNAGTSGTDIYAYDLSTSEEIAVCTDAGDQIDPVCNSRYVAYIGENDTNLYLYDIETEQTTTVHSGEVGQIKMSTGSSPSDSLIIWGEYHTNENGTFHTIYYKSCDNLSADPICVIDESTVNDTMYLANNSNGNHIAWFNTTDGKAFVYKVSDQSVTMVDDGEFISGMMMDDEYLVWCRIYSDPDKNWEPCAAELP